MFKKIIDILMKSKISKENNEDNIKFHNLTRPFRALIITDTHGHIRNSLHTFLEDVENVDIIFTLGDIDFRDHEELKNIKKIKDIPKFGVLGNHDYFNDLKNNGIESIHGKLITYNGIRITGMYGSYKYKNTDAPMLTDEESEQFAALIPECDLFLTHDWNKHKEIKNDSHKGLSGITKYILRCQPKYHIHGHIHENIEEKIGITTSIGFCRYAYIEFQKDGIHILKKYGDF